MFASTVLRAGLRGGRFIRRVRAGDRTAIAISQQRTFMQYLGIKTATISNADVCDLLNSSELFATDEPITSLNGRLLAEKANEAISEKGITELVAYMDAMMAQHLGADATAAGLRGVAARAEKEAEGHVYMHVLKARVSDELMAALVASVDLDPLAVAITAFQAFPGSFDAEGSPRSSIAPLQRGPDGLTPGDDLGFLAITDYPPPLGDTRDYELGIGNVVTISSAARMVEKSAPPIFAWMNSTTYRHTFDGRVDFVLKPDFATHSLVLGALGFGAHPLGAVPIVGKFPDWLNVNLGAVVFDTMLASLVEAMEHYVRAKKIKKFTNADLAEIRKSLAMPLPALSERLILRHLLLEVFGLLSIPTLQAARLITGGNTTDSPK